jgi:Omp85 superfamily domain/Calcineurin-like phosphoesterase
MIKYALVYIGFLLFLTSAVYAQNDSILSRIVLIGDAGELLGKKNAVVEAVKKTVVLDKKTTILYLGDNAYPNGLPDEFNNTYSDIKSILDTQINIGRGTDAKIIMVPGNHDWDNGSAAGYEFILREANYVNSSGLKNVFFYPESGCPGPVEVSIGKDITLILFDSQWWLTKQDKPGIESDCEFKTEDEVLTAIGDIVKKNFKKLIIFACHHPFKSNGIHGGYYGLKQHIFPFTDLNRNLYIPLPLIGSIYPISRSVFGSPQDLKFPTYFNMVTKIQQVTKAHPHVIFVAGHDHGLQLIKDSNFNYIVSGGGSKDSRVEKSKLSKFVDQALGFATLDILSNKIVRANFFTLRKDSVLLSYSDTILDFSKLPPLALDTATTIVSKFKDSISVPASNLYKNPSGFRSFLIGKNYRSEWSVPVKMKVFNLNTEKGGFVIEGMGGGKQTKTLGLRDKQGNKWVLRTIDKDPEKALPPDLRLAVAKDITQDLISASHPYAALTIPPMAIAAGITESAPEYFFVPNDYSFGDYRTVFANKVCMLEQTDPTYDGSDTKSSDKVINKLFEDNRRKVDQRAVLNARLLDMMIGDWDRHFEQWKWGTADSGKGKIYYPVPKDRDQAYFYSDGLIIRFVSRRIMPFSKGFRKDIPKINEWNFSAKDFDRFFLNHLSKEEWQEVVTNFVLRENDSVIEAAMRQFPPEIKAMDKSLVAEKLRSRRDLLKTKALVYYDFLAKQVNLLGSNMDEYFKISGNEKAGLDIEVFAKTDHLDSNALLYRRSFQPKATQEIRLYGLGGNDVFDIEKNANSPIKLSLIGGKGIDSFLVKSRLKTYIYDYTKENNFVSKGARTKVYLQNDAEANSFNLKGFTYNVKKIPNLAVGFNPDDGVLVGAGLLLRNYGFLKKPFSSEQRFTGLFALTHRAFQFRYSGTFINVFRKTDVLVDAFIADPALNYFYGFGNSTKMEPGTKAKFYRVRYKYLDVDVLFRKKPFNILSIIAGPSFYQYWNKYSPNKDYVLGAPYLVKLDSANIFKRKDYLGGKALVIVNNLNSEVFPTRGVLWSTEFTALRPLTKDANSLTRLRSDMTVYASLSDPAKVVAVLHLGAGHIFSDKYEYFQALSLGSDDYLRGFRKNRYEGSSLAYLGTELRIKLFESGSYILPGTIGMVGFNEIGRVWIKEEQSKQWHDAFGAGLYYFMYHLVLVSATVAYTGEGVLLNVSLGTKFNITF